MKFLTIKDLNLNIKEDLLEQIADSDQLIDYEARAISTISNYLNSIYDMNFEFREIVDYDINTIYNDHQRLRLTQNEEHDAFGELYNIQLIDSNILSDKIIVKKSNTCEQQYVTAYPNSSYLSQNRLNTMQSHNKYNELYDANCGLINCVDGALQTNNIYNQFNSIYTTSGIVQIDYSILTKAEAADYQSNEYFDNYLLSNYNRDFGADDRNISLIMMTCDIMLYELLTTVSPSDFSENYYNRYEQSMQLLKDIAKGKCTINLKKYDYTVAYQTKNAIKWGISKI